MSCRPPFCCPPFRRPLNPCEIFQERKRHINSRKSLGYRPGVAGTPSRTNRGLPTSVSGISCFCKGQIPATPSRCPTDILPCRGFWEMLCDFVFVCVPLLLPNHCPESAWLCLRMPMSGNAWFCLKVFRLCARKGLNHPERAEFLSEVPVTLRAEIFAYMIFLEGPEKIPNLWCAFVPKVFCDPQTWEYVR